MKYVVAVSGGVDSVVLLDMLSKATQCPLVVAHFDHGIREDSAEDARFVEQLAARYGHYFVSERAELGRGASEAVARTHRYAFLRRIAAEHSAPVVTAHHLDDLVETVAINTQRGTGWRGVAVFGAPVVRPLVDTPKAALKAYARANGLVWREDSTNTSDDYMRNRIRKRAAQLPYDVKRQIRALHAEQTRLRHEIEHEVRQLVGEGPEYSRHLFIQVTESVALECLRQVTGAKLTRPQCLRALHAVKTAAPGARYQAGGGVMIQFSTRHFTVELVKL